MTIEDFEYGRIVVDGREERRDVILTPTALHSNWWRTEGHRLSLDDLDDVLEEAPEILVVGMGTTGQMLPEPGLDRALADRGIEMEAMRTDAAVARFNELLQQGASVAAALHLTC